MGFLDRIKAFFPSFTPNDQTNSDESSMPDISTQTPPKWASATNTPTEQKDLLTPTRKAKMAANMDETDYQDCWKIIDAMAEGHVGVAKRAIGDSVTGTGIVRHDAAATHFGGDAQDDNIQTSTPPTPGSGHKAYIEPSPLQLAAQAAADVEMAEVREGGIVRQTSVERQIHREMSSAAEITQDTEDAVDSSEEVPTPEGPQYKDEIEAMDRDVEIKAIAPQAQPIQPAKAVDANTTSAHVILATNVREEEPEFEKDIPLEEAFARISDDDEKDDPTLPEMPSPEDVNELEGLLPGIASEIQTSAPAPPPVPPSTVLQEASPNFPFTIEAAGQAINNGVLDTTAAAHVPETDRPRSRSSAPSPPPSQIQIKAEAEIEIGQVSALGPEPQISQQLGTDTQQPTIRAQRTSDTVDFAAQEQVRGAVLPSIVHLVDTPKPRADSIQIFRDRSESSAVTEAEVNPKAGHKSPEVVIRTPKANSLASSPANMPVKLPDAFHQAVLDGAIAEGATHEEQVGLMTALREAEKTANIAEVKVEGAMEVDASELDAPSPIQPIALAEVEEAPSEVEAPPTTPANKPRQRKRKADDTDTPAAAKKSKKDIQAFTDREHLANGWEFKPEKYWNAMKADQLKDFLRTVASQKRWWNGLNKATTVKKIMEWQADMKALQEAQLAFDNGEDIDGEEPEGEPELEEVDETAHKQAMSRAASVLSRNSKSKSKTPMAAPETPADQTALASAFNRGASSGAYSDRSVFYEPGARERSTPLLGKLQKAKSESVEDVAQPMEGVLQDVAVPETMPKKRANRSSTSALSSVPPSPRRSRSKTADSAKANMSATSEKLAGVKKGANGAAKKTGGGRKSVDAIGRKSLERKNRASVEPGEAVGERVRSLRSRTASVAPESYGTQL